MVAASKIIDLTKDDDEKPKGRKRLRTTIVGGDDDDNGDDRDGADGADGDDKDDKGRVVIVIDDDDDDDDDQQVDGAFPAAAAAAVHGGYLRDETSYDDLRDAISHKRLSVKASNGRYAQRTLLLGMYHSCGTQECYTVDKPGQGYRDLLRCQALENVGYIVHTCDNKHTEEFVYKKRGRRKKEVPVADRPGVHLYHDFADWRRLQTAMAEMPKFNSKPFELILLDYFFSPQGWADVRWTDGFFRDTIPGFAATDKLYKGGRIWLPFLPLVQILYPIFWSG